MPGTRSDIWLIAVATVLGGLFFWDRLVTDPPGTVGAVVDLAIGVLACAALSLRRRWPVWLAAFLLPSMVFSSSALGATAVALSAVALYRPRRVTVFVVAAHVLLLAVIFTLAGQDVWEGFIALVALDAAMVASGWLVRSERQQRLVEQNRARLAERERIAREMHDVLAHRLSLLVVYAGALQVRKSAPEQERQAAGIVRRGAVDALEDLREAIWMLRDPNAAESDRPQPTLCDVPVLIEQSRLSGTRIGFENGIADPTAVAPNIGRHLYRVIQEGLTNARKHAPGAPVSVNLSSESGLSVEIVNPLPEGLTAAVMPGAGAGLIGLRERMTLLGGRLDFGAAGDTYRLHAWLPLAT